MKKATFEIGTKFKTRGKHPRLCTIVDIYTTTNSNNEIVKIEYLATHEFMGQNIRDLHNGTSVAMGRIV